MAAGRRGLRVITYGWAHFLSAAYSYLPSEPADVAKAIQNLTGNIRLHADLLDFAASGSVCGILAYILILSAPIEGVLTSPRDSQFRARGMGVGILCVGYFACGLTYLMFGYEFHTTPYVLLAIILVSFCRDSPPEDTVPLPASDRDLPPAA